MESGCSKSLIATLFLLLMLLQMGQPVDSTDLQDSQKWNRACRNLDGCRCTSKSRSQSIMNTCCCVGPSVVHIPPNLTDDPKTVQALHLHNTNITFFWSGAFQNFTFLEDLVINNARITMFNYTSLANNTNLRKITIRHCKSLKRVEGWTVLAHPMLTNLDLQSNALEQLPQIEMGKREVNRGVDITFAGNRIEKIKAGLLRNVNAETFKLGRNRLRMVEDNAFANCTIHVLQLNDNPDLTELPEHAFAGISLFSKLDLSRTSISELPKQGMKGLTDLHIEDVETLKKLPSVVNFLELKRAKFTYPHHCCLFKHAAKELDLAGDEDKQIFKKRICKKHQEIERNLTKVRIEPVVESEEDPDAFGWKPSGPQDEPYTSSELGVTACLEEETNESEINDMFMRIECSPAPDEMNPCESIVGFPWLRYAIWFFWISSVILNIIVWLILAVAYESRKRAHYIFMFNLSFANALSAIYLGLLAVEDRKTHEEYWMYAVGWQTGVWCRAAGALCVFSSSLSILSMFFIAFEIAYSTRQAIFGRHLSFRICMYCVVFSYVFSFTMAGLPLLGVSDYSKTSTCLPLYIETPLDRIYIIFGLSLLIFAFIGMVGCYGSIFRILMDPATPSRPEDHHIIMKMLALIITDMLCWMPSCVLGLSAAFGHPLISISTAKIFIICFFPLNTFTNPFLYVFLTKVIRSKVKQRAVPVFKRLMNTPRHTLHSLSVLYHMHGPEDRRRRSNDSSKFASVNQSTTTATSRPASPHPGYQDTTTTKSSWLNGSSSGSPRGSAESTALLLARGESPPPPGWERNRRRSTPRVSFQSTTSSGIGSATSEGECAHQKPEKPATSGRFSSILKKVSAIPEVSDLSEHSADSHHEHVITVHRSPRPDQRPSGGARSDSGRSSLASIFARSDYSSSALSECCSEDGGGPSSTTLLLSSSDATVPLPDAPTVPKATVPSMDTVPSTPPGPKQVLSETSIVIGLGAPN